RPPARRWRRPPGPGCVGTGPPPRRPGCSCAVPACCGRSRSRSSHRRVYRRRRRPRPRARCGRVAGYRGAMTAQPDPGPRRARGARPDPAQELARVPRLDSAGRIADDDEPEPAPLPGPSPLLPSLVTAVGVGLTVLAVVDVVRTVPAPGGARPMNAAVLAA